MNTKLAGLTGLEPMLTTFRPESPHWLVMPFDSQQTHQPIIHSVLSSVKGTAPSWIQFPSWKWPRGSPRRSWLKQSSLDGSAIRELWVAGWFRNQRPPVDHDVRSHDQQEQRSTPVSDDDGAHFVSAHMLRWLFRPHFGANCLYTAHNTGAHKEGGSKPYIKWSSMRKEVYVLFLELLSEARWSSV